MDDMTCPFNCGDRVYAVSDERFVGRVVAHTGSGNVVIRWPSGVRSYVPTAKVRAAPPSMWDNE